MDEIVEREDNNVGKQKVSNPWLWSWLQRDVNIDIKSVHMSAKCTGESIVKIYLKDFQKGLA